MTHFSVPIFRINDVITFTSAAGEILWTRTGKVAGYSTQFPVMYIVTLDEPLTHPDFLGWSAVVAHGSMLEIRK